MSNNVKVISLGLQTDITGQEIEYFKMGAKNKAGHIRICESVPATDVDRIRIELTKYARESEVPATLAKIRF